MPHRSRGLRLLLMRQLLIEQLLLLLLLLVLQLVLRVGCGKELLLLVLGVLGCTFELL